MSEIKDKAVRLLVKFGLTQKQARVYFEVAMFDKAGIKTLLKSSTLSKPDLYKTLAELEKIGFLEKLSNAPTEYKAISLEQAISTFLQSRNIKTIELQKRTINFLQNISKKTDINHKIQDLELTIVKDPQGYFFKKALENEEVREKIDMVTTSAFLAFLMLNMTKELKEALNRGVKIRILAQKHETVLREQLQKSIQTLSKTPLFQIKFSSLSPSAILSLFDNGKVVIAISILEKLEETSFAWSSNHNIIELAQNYFENLWASKL